jgi:1,4-dihydroxy-6-naphthoate synthase
VRASERRRVRVGHSPDPDDAFMFFGIASGAVDTGRYAIEQVLEDIESLNRRALAGGIEVTAASIHACAYLADQYALMPCGASMGDGYGPCVVARSAFEPRSLAERVIAVPGTLTSAYLALRLYIGRDFAHRVVPFDRILEHVENGTVDAGLIIHEGQLTYGDHHLRLIVDLGAWWAERSGGLPLPLGGNVVLRALGQGSMRELTDILRRSIDYGLEHRSEALDYAMDFGRGLDRALTDRFVGLYVNDWTRDYGDRGRKAVEHLLELGRTAGLLPEARITFVD